VRLFLSRRGVVGLKRREERGVETNKRKRQTRGWRRNSNN
jgi:hypothetical protein